MLMCICICVCMFNRNTVFFNEECETLSPLYHRQSKEWNGNASSQGGRGNFTYLLEGQINFALKLSVGCLISQF